MYLALKEFKWLKEFKLVVLTNAHVTFSYLVKNVLKKFKQKIKIKLEIIYSSEPLWEADRTCTWS